MVCYPLGGPGQNAMVVTGSYGHCPIESESPEQLKDTPNQGLGCQVPFGGNKADRRAPPPQWAPDSQAGLWREVDYKTS
jgi:hypothetical protein